MVTPRYTFLKWAALVVLALVSVPAQAASRVALVIGNAAYAHAPTLANPLNDAADIGATLARLGFSVTRLRNADYATLRRGLQEFTRTASGSEVALVYYAGHGIEVDQRNYLVPVDARLVTDQDVEFETVPLDLVLRSVERAAGLRLVILDACRENPFAASMRRTGTTRSIGRGLARVEPSGNTLVAYAAKGGTVALDGQGRNSPYAAALLTHLQEPGLEVGMLFRRVRDSVLASTRRQQEPFWYGSLSSEGVYLKAAPATMPPRKTPPITVSVPEFDDVHAAARRGDYATALKGYRILAERGSSAAQNNLGVMYEYGNGVARNHTQAVRWYRKAAEQGNALAQTNLGVMYSNGRGVAQSHAEAVRWYRKAAEQGNTRAQNNLGDMYYNGRGVARSYAEAVRWYRKAARQGYARAQNDLGHMYVNGYGVAQDLTEAMRWFRKAAEQGSARGQYHVGDMYYYGWSVSTDIDEAMRWYRKAADQGYAPAKEALKRRPWWRPFG